MLRFHHGAITLIMMAFSRVTFGIKAHGQITQLQYLAVYAPECHSTDCHFLIVILLSVIM